MSETVVSERANAQRSASFYLNLAARGKWSKRELAHQIKTAAFERTALSDKKLAPAARVLPQDATGVFKDSYLLDFDLSERHSEADLQAGLLRILRLFLMELGNGFAFVGEKNAGAGGQPGF
jgi:predicted nuclease of restriction endonuclease-like (RecB) superfamily